MNTRRTIHIPMAVTCPWCSSVVNVDVEFGAFNTRAPLGRRATSMRVRPKSSGSHVCIDPTAKGLPEVNYYQCYYCQRDRIFCTHREVDSDGRPV